MGDNEPVGQHLAEHLYNWNQALRAAWSQSVETTHLLAIDHENIQVYFNHYKHIIKSFHVLPQNTWNMDEKGFSIGYIHTQKIITAANDKDVFEKMPGNQEWVSLVKTICMDSQKIDLMVIFKGNKTVNSFYYKDMSQWTVTFSLNSWMSNDLTIVWLQEVFLLQTKPSDSEAAWILILDGHGSHININFILECLDHHVHPVFLPAKTSHIMQPLNVGVFRPVSTYYTQYLNQWSSEQPYNANQRVGKADFIHIYNQAHQDSFSKQNVHSAWHGAGLCLYNLSWVMDSIKYPIPELKMPLKDVSNV